VVCQPEPLGTRRNIYQIS